MNHILRTRRHQYEHRNHSEQWEPTRKHWDPKCGIIRWEAPGRWSNDGLTHRCFSVCPSPHPSFAGLFGGVRSCCRGQAGLRAVEIVPHDEAVEDTGMDLGASSSSGGQVLSASSGSAGSAAVRSRSDKLPRSTTLAPRSRARSPPRGGNGRAQSAASKRMPRPPATPPPGHQPQPLYARPVVLSPRPSAVAVPPDSARSETERLRAELAEMKSRLDEKEPSTVL